MTIFQQFRLWVRRAPIGERLSALVGVALSVAVVAWLLVPASAKSHSVTVGTAVSGNQGGFTTGTASNRGASASGPAAGQEGASGGGNVSGAAGGTGGTSSAAGGTSGAATGPASAAPAPGQSRPGGSGGNGSTSHGGCVSPPGADQGISAGQIKIAVILINLAGPTGNSAVGVPSPAEQQQDFEQVISSVNVSGGVACRQLVATYYSPNIADQSQLQQTCLQIVSSKPFVAIDLGAFSFFPSLATCIPQNQLPLMSGLAIPQRLQSQFYPYYFSLGPIADLYYRNSIFALKQIGFFNGLNSLSKLGLAYRSCNPQYYSEVIGYLHQVGISSSQIVSTNDGCPATAITPPNVVEQDVVTFEENHVSNVTFVDDVASWESWTQIANSDGFHPKYGFPDDGEVAICSTSSGPCNWQNTNGAIAIEYGRYGEPNTPGIPQNAATVTCNAIYAKYGRPTVYQQSDGIGGVACSDIFELRAALDHAPILQRTAIAAGLQASRSVDLSYPSGPDNFAGYHVTTGGQYWRTVEAFSSCTCWRVTRSTFEPSFP